LIRAEADQTRDFGPRYLHRDIEKIKASRHRTTRPGILSSATLTPTRLVRPRSSDGLSGSPIIWETGMMMNRSGMDPERLGRRDDEQELAVRIEGCIERRASGRIRDLHVVCSEDTIILQGRSRTYHAKQLAQQAVLDLTDGYPLLANQIVVCC